MPKAKDKLFLELIDQGRNSKNYDALMGFIEKLKKDEIEWYTRLIMSKRFRYGEEIYYFILLRLFKNIVDSRSSYDLLLIEENIINGKYRYSDTTIFYGNLESAFYLIAAQQLDSVSPLEDFRFALHRKYKIDTNIAYVFFAGSNIKDSLKKAFLQHVSECNNYFSYNRLEDFRSCTSDLMLFIAASKNKAFQYEDKNEILFQLFIALKDDEFRKIHFFLLNQIRLLVLAFIFGNARKTFKETGFNKEELTILFSPLEKFNDGYYGDYLCEFLIPQMSNKIRHTDLIEEYLTLYLFAKDVGVRFVGILASQDIRNKRNSKSAEAIKQIKVPDGSLDLPIGYEFWGTEESFATIYYYENRIVYLEFRDLTSFSLFSLDTTSVAFSKFINNSEFYVQTYLRTKHLLILMPVVAKVSIYLGMAFLFGSGVAVEAFATDYTSAKLEEAGITHTQFLQIALMLAQLLRGRIKARSAAALEDLPLQKAGALTKAGVEAETEVVAKATKTAEITQEARMARAAEGKLDQTAEKKLEKKINERGTSNPATGANGTQAKALDPEVDRAVESGIVEEAQATQYLSKPKLPSPIKTEASITARKNFESLLRDKYAKILKVGKEGQVHHAIEIQVLDRYPGAFTKAEINAIENMRGVTKEGLGKMQLHNSAIRLKIDDTYRFINSEIIKRHLIPGTVLYNSFVRKTLFECRSYIDFIYGQFFTESRFAFGLPI